MLSKTLLCFLLLSGCVLALLVDKCQASAEEVSVLFDQAEDYEHQANYEQAEAIYKQILGDYGGTNDGLKAQEKLTILYIEWDKEPQAEVAFNDLVTQFCENEGLPKAVDHVADAYREEEKYAKAREVYQYVVQRWPEAEGAAEAQAGVARSSILMGDEAGTAAAIEKLTTGFSTSTHIAKAVDATADEYRKAGRFEKALPWHQYVLDHWPEDTHAMEAQKGVVLSYMGLQDEPNAQAAISRLIGHFSQHSKLRKALYEIARRYEKLLKFDSAASVYGNLIEHCAASAEATDAPLDIRKVEILSLVESDDDSGVPGAIETLVAEFAGHEYLPVVVYKMAVQYHLRAYRMINEGLTDKSMDCFRKAAGLFERTVNDFPGCEPAAKAYRSAGDCYRKLGEYNKSIHWYQKVVDEYPNFETAWNALFLVGRNYEELEKSAAIAESEADVKIKAAYEKLLRDYPRCKAAKYAGFWLSRHSGSQ